MCGARVTVVGGSIYCQISFREWLCMVKWWLLPLGADDFSPDAGRALGWSLAAIPF